MARTKKFKRPSPFVNKTSGPNPSKAAKNGDDKKRAQNDTNQSKASTIERPQRLKAATKRLPETTGLILRTEADDNYAILDSGNGEKLERYNGVKIIRPEGQAIWQRSKPANVWQDADAIFTGDTDEEGMGRWAFPKKQLNETWPMAWDGMPYYGRFTSFRHTGVFPEQAAHWRFMMEQIKNDKARKEPPKILNLFGYTGVASLVAARAGAHVTHVDASKKAIGWAKENQQLAGLEDKPIRWICEDAVKFCEREVRRGNHYDGILLDPPAYGRGPKGEVWQMFEDAPYLTDLCKQLVSKNPLFVVLTAYAIRASFYSIHELMQEVFGDMGGEIHSGELVIETENSKRCIPTSMFSRWVAPAASPKGTAK